jgi:hypothetical protein
MEAEVLTPSVPTLKPPTKRVTFDEFLDWLTEETKADAPKQCRIFWIPS